MRAGPAPLPSPTWLGPAAHRLSSLGAIDRRSEPPIGASAAVAGYTRDMADAPIDLERYRKRRARQEKKASAATNRAVHGRSKDDRRQALTAKERALRELEGKKLERDPEPPPE